MEDILDQFFERQQAERRDELRYINQSSSAVQLATENYFLTQMLSRRLHKRNSQSNPTNSTQQQVDNINDNELDGFFQAQRTERLAEVASLGNQTAHVNERTSLLDQLFRRRLRADDDEETEPEPIVSELEAVERSQRVSMLLGHAFRSQLENAIASGLSSARQRRNNRVSNRSAIPPDAQTPNTRAQPLGSVHPPPLPPLPESPPPSPPIGWETLFVDNETAEADRIVRNERFDVLAEISGLLGDQLVSRALNSTIADVLESHLRNRIEAAPSVFTSQAREEALRTLENLPRHQRARNDFSDVGIINNGPPNEPAWRTRRRQEPTLRHNQQTRVGGSWGSRQDDRVQQLEEMMLSMQNLLNRQTQSQIQLENAVQQVILNQTLLSSNATGISISVQPDTAGRCVVCLDDSKPVDTAFYKCGHVITCTPCAAVLLAANPYCPLCRQKIDDVIKLYKLT